MKTLGRSWLLVLLAAVFTAAMACNGNSDLLTADPNDSDFPLSDESSLLDGTPTNDELSEDGKFDAVYPETFSDLVVLQSPVKNTKLLPVLSVPTVVDFKTMTPSM